MLNKVYYENEQGVVVTYIVEFGDSEMKELQEELNRVNLKIMSLSNDSYCSIDIGKIIKRQKQLEKKIQRLKSDSLPDIIA